MEVGKRYRGYGFINEYREFSFEPEATGSHAGREKCISSKDGIRVSATKNLVLVKFNIEKKENKLDYIKALTKIFNTISTIFNEYEI